MARVKAFAFDVDGVFTDGKVILLPSGEMLRAYNAKDGFAVAAAVRLNYPLAIISGGTGEAMKNRFAGLGITDLYLSCGDKLEALTDFCCKYGLSPADVLFMGDDTPDLEVMGAVGLPVAPADAVHEVKRAARHVSAYKGGDGCVRDVVEQVLRAQGKWSDVRSGTGLRSR